MQPVLRRARRSGGWRPPVLDLQPAHGAQSLRRLNIGAFDNDAFADGADPKQGDQDRDGGQALSRYSRYCHAGTSIIDHCTEAQQASLLPKSIVFCYQPARRDVV
jgi:hypothetical protein